MKHWDFWEKMTLKIVHGIVFYSYLIYPENWKVWMTYNKKVQIYKLWCWVTNSREVKLEVILGNSDVWDILWGLETPINFIINMGISFLNYNTLHWAKIAVQYWGTYHFMTVPSRSTVRFSDMLTVKYARFYL